jgi:Na+-transporting NADH:ubiquinone oxidoreductase subunit C
MKAGEPGIEVAKGAVDPDSPMARHRVDGLSGATLTSNGVTNLLQFWLGDLGYGPFLERIAREQGAPGPG